MTLCRRNNKIRRDQDHISKRSVCVILLDLTTESGKFWPWSVLKSKVMLTSFQPTEIWKDWIPNTPSWQVSHKFKIKKAHSGGAAPRHGGIMNLLCVGDSLTIVGWTAAKMRKEIKKYQKLDLWLKIDTWQGKLKSCRYHPETMAQNKFKVSNEPQW